MNATLDINTERGRIAASDQQYAAEKVFGANGYTFLHTDDTEAAAIDGIIVSKRTGFIAGVGEIKTRDMTKEKLFGEFNGEWLVTFSKLEDIAKCCALLKVSGFGLLYLKPSEIVLTVKIADEHGKIVCPFRIDRTETQATCNGGKASRVNAFIKMHRARSYA